MIVWSASWCMPCKGLKAWLGVNHPDIPIKDVETEHPPPGVKSVPTLQDGEAYYFGTTAIKKRLGELR